MAIIKVKTGGITADAVTDALIADDVVGTEHLTANEVDTTALGADAVTGAQLADDAVNSEHYTDGSVDTAHIADAQITTAKLSTAVFTGATDIGADLADADLILVDDGAGGTIRKAALSRIKTYTGGGKVLQVITAETTTNTQITSTSYADTSLTANITPSATSSKILVLVSQNVQMERATYEINTFLQLLKDSTAISVKTVGMGTGAANSQGCRHTFSISHLDEPSTTSQITYKTQGKVNNTGDSGTCRFQEGSTRSEIVLIEIEG